jgi:hypothetical protein
MIEKSLFVILKETKENFNLKECCLLWNKQKEKNSIYYKVNSKKIDEKLWIIKKEIEIFNLNNDKILREKITQYLLNKISECRLFLSSEILLIEEDNKNNMDNLKLIITGEYE